MQLPRNDNYNVKRKKDKEREWNAIKEEIKDVTDRVKNIGISEDVVRAEKSSKEQQLQEAEKEKVHRTAY